MPHDQPASDWVCRFARSLPPGCSVLDLACGSGRHTRHFAAAGHLVTAVDRHLTKVADLRDHPSVELIQTDLEIPSPHPAESWPEGCALVGRTFDCIVVTNYLHRPLFPAILGAVAPGGMLLYETFAQGNERFGRPSNPDFLLRPHELLEVVRDLQVVAFEQGSIHRPAPAVIQRICAVRPPGDSVLIPAITNID